MEKQLITKVQKLVKKPADEDSSFSSAFEITPDDDVALQKKGTLYVVFDVLADKSLDTLLITKVVYDVLHDSYYQSENTSPIQALEKALVDVSNKVTELSRSGDTAAHKVEFNILASVLWGNVLYIVQFGVGSSFLVREGDVKPISVASEGNFSIASGVIKDNDVIFLGTDSFVKEHAPGSLLEATESLSSHKMPKRAAALLLKFTINTSFTEKEVIDFGFNKGNGDVASVDAPPKIEIKLRSKKRQFLRNPFKVVIPLVVIALGISLFYTYKQRGVNVETEDSSKEESVGEKNVSGEAPVKVEPFYDIKIVDENAEPTGIIAFGDNLVAVDTNSGKIYASSLETPQFVQKEGSFFGIRDLDIYDGDLTFVDSEGFKVYSLEDEKVLESYAAENLGVSRTYLDFVYTADVGEITKYTKETNTLDGTLWGNLDGLSEIISMSIDGSIYVLDKNGDLASFTRGENDNVEFTGIELSDPIQIYTTYDLEFIYVADKGNSRVVVFGKSGVFEKEIKSDDGSWGDMRGIAVTDDEKSLFVLAGSKVYEVDLTQ